MLAEEIEIADGDGTIAEVCDAALVVARGRGINLGVREVEEILVRLALARSLPNTESYAEEFLTGSSKSSREIAEEDGMTAEEVDVALWARGGREWAASQASMFLLLPLRLRYF